jgi:16S rRNA (uracil1498-N3)-methyltransferase
VLRGEEHHHLKNVARIKPGEKVWLIDKSGKSYIARVDQIEKNQTRLSILDTKEKIEPRVKVTLAQALIKARNFELILQKATELGIKEFLPVITSRSVVKIDDKLENKMARWAKIAREAAKQSGVFQVPVILMPKTLEDVVRDRMDTIKIFLNESGGKPLRYFLVSNSTEKWPEQHPSSALVLIGPEGGWTEAEEEDIVSHGFEAISLGRQILRAETAAISSLAMIDHFWNQ